MISEPETKTSVAPEIEIEMLARAETLLALGRPEKARVVMADLLAKMTAPPTAQKRFDAVLDSVDIAAALRTHPVFWPGKAHIILRSTLASMVRDDAEGHVHAESLLEIMKGWPIQQDADFHVHSCAALASDFGHFMESGHLEKCRIFVRYVTEMIPNFDKQFRVICVRCGLKLITSENHEAALQLSQALLEDWPTWPAAQRLASEMTKALFSDGRTDLAASLLVSTTEAWPHKTRDLVHIATEWALAAPMATSATRAGTLEVAPDGGWRDLMLGALKDLEDWIATGTTPAVASTAHEIDLRTDIELTLFACLMGRTADADWVEAHVLSALPGFTPPAPTALLAMAQKFNASETPDPRITFIFLRPLLLGMPSKIVWAEHTEMLEGLVTALLEVGAFSSAVELGSALKQNLPSSSLKYRVQAIEVVTHLLKIDALRRAVPLMQGLLRDWPTWPAAQRISGRLARQFMYNGQPEQGIAVLRATNQYWPDKSIFEVMQVAKEVETVAPGWRQQFLAVLKRIDRAKRGEAFDDVTIDTAHKAKAGLKPQHLAEEASKVLARGLQTTLEAGQIANAHWMARKLGKINPDIEKDYRINAIKRGNALLADDALESALHLVDCLVKDYPKSQALVKLITLLTERFIETGDVTRIEALIRQSKLEKGVRTSLLIACAAARVGQVNDLADVQWKWVIHRIWRELRSDGGIPLKTLEAEMTTRFIATCEALLEAGHSDRANWITTAITKRIPTFSAAYWDMIQVRARAQMAAGNLAQASDLIYQVIAANPQRGTAHTLALQIALARLTKNYADGRAAFTRFWQGTGHRRPLNPGKLNSRIISVLLSEVKTRVAAGDLVTARALHDCCGDELSDFRRRFRVQNIVFAGSLIRKGEIAEAASIVHMIVQLHPDWDSGLHMANRVIERLIAQNKRDMAFEIIAQASNSWPQKYLFELDQFMNDMVWQDAHWNHHLSGWWSRFKAAGGLENPEYYMPARSQMIMIANRMLEDGILDRAETTLLALSRHITGDSETEMALARICEARADYRRAVERWQMAAALSKTSNNEQGRYMVQHGKAAHNLLTTSNVGLRAARCHFAMQLQTKGETREYTEVVSRITESLGSTSIYQEDRLVLDALSGYVRHCLAETHPTPNRVSRGSTKPKRIVMCLDVLKLSDFHLHSRVVFTMSRSMLDRVPDLDINMVITNERFAVTRPNIASWIDFDGNDYTYEYAARTLGEHFGKRFHLHFQRSYGLEGVVRSCREILDLKPDMIAYAGGHGRYSNDSRIVRHALMRYMPSALFFLGVDNAIDDQVDMIIPRGPHELLGDPGAATIRLQTYPTLPDGEERVKVPEEKPLPRFIVTALAGSRFDTRMRDLPEQHLRMFLSILDKNPDVVWHFVGPENPSKLLKDVPLLGAYAARGQVKVRSVMEINEFREFVTDATLFLQLPGFKGGAGGAGMARRGGVPVLTFANTDVSGRQPPETVFEEDDIAGITSLAAHLLQNPDQATRITQAQFDYADHIRETAAYGFYDCLTETVDLARTRLRETIVTERAQKKDAHAIVKAMSQS